MLSSYNSSQFSYSSKVSAIDETESFSKLWINSDYHCSDSPPELSAYESGILREQSRLDRLERSIETGGSIFVLGLMVMQTLAPLPAPELAGRILFACWTLTAFRMVQSRGATLLAAQLVAVVVAMMLMPFTSAYAVVNGQIAIDAALICAAWAALAARWFILFKGACLRTMRADLELDRHRHRILKSAAAR